MSEWRVKQKSTTTHISVRWDGREEGAPNRNGGSNPDEHQKNRCYKKTGCSRWPVCARAEWGLDGGGERASWGAS